MGLDIDEELQMETVSNVVAIKRYFEADGGRKVTMEEMKALTADDKKEMGEAAARLLGVTIG